MAGLLDQLLELLGLRGKPKKRRGPRGGLRRPGMAHCRQCHAGIRPGMARCPHCGAMLAEATTRRRSPGKITLTDLQRELLTAAAGSDDRTIYVIPPEASDEGEVKVGSLRKGGAEALRAVDRLWKLGLLTPTGGSSFTLTEDGLQILERL